ncbi:uncharacterized protein C11orf16 homolog isoform X2 [Poecilia reticulata]|uniref:uncharacterized protein C11orf16 homolog isoform X2 n=1 Tax=Poecilia reticulata TaxID=8081 RepID=UPI0007EB510B|nr:PREDICTED: uncharacterized protein C11orf16 isoform X2 [Poecilia reticulata]
MQTQGSKGLWVVEFDHGGSAGFGTASSQRELVCSLDLVVDSRGHNHRLVPGDFVLSPWESDLRRYGPGRVVAVASHRADVVADFQVLMWNSSVSLVPDSLVLPVSLYHYFRLVRQLQIPAPAFGRCSSQVCSKSPCPIRRPYTHCCQSTHTQLPCVVSTSCRCGLEESGHFNTDEFVRNGHSETPSPPSTLPTIEENTSNSPEAKLWSKRQRPPWRYWRRTGPEPQHKQPGSEVNRTTSQRSSLAVPQISSSPNHSSLFQSLPDANAKNMNIRDVFGTASFKPRPPAQRQSFSAGKATLILT